MWLNISATTLERVKMDEKSSERIVIGFKMPYNGIMEIRASKPIDDDVDIEDEIEGVIYLIYWNDIQLPWHTKTQWAAIIMALGCQWGAKEMLKIIGNKNES